MSVSCIRRGWRAVLNKNSNSSAMHLLARLQRTRSIGRPPYEDLGSKTLMKASFQRFFTA